MSEAADARSDPRVDRTRRAVIDAAVALMEAEGSAAISHQRVAEASGVGRATLYRHWPTAAELLYDVLRESEQPILRPRDEPLVAWLRTELRRDAIEFGTPAAVQLLAVLVGRGDHDPAAAELRRRLVDHDILHLAVAVARAAVRGELAGEPDAHDLFARLIGPIVLRVAIQRRPATDEFVDDVIATALAPWLPRPGQVTTGKVTSGRLTTRSGSGP